MCNEEVAHLAGFKKRSEEDVVKTLEVFIEDSKTCLWAIADKKDNKAIGWVEIHEEPKQGEKTYEIGYCLNKKYWGKGIMPEVVLTLIEQVKKSGKAEQFVYQS